MSELLQQLRKHYPALADLPDVQLERDLRRLPCVEVPERHPLFREQEPCSGFPFILDGTVRVARGSPDGRELELYRVGAGEICVVSTACLLRGKPMDAHGSTLAPTRLLLVDRDTLLRWADTPSVRLFLLGIMAERMAELIALVEAVAFQRLDQRLARTLLSQGPRLRVTHQQLADELGTAREMVSRLLKRFEDQGWLRLGREQIDVLDADPLRSLAGTG